MQFLRRNRYALLTLAVLLVSAALVVQQYLASHAAHTQQVEDFLLLHESGVPKPSEHLYQTLVQQLPRIDDRALVQDLQRTAMVVDLKTPQLDNLVWKYHVSVKNELKQRAKKRMATVLEAATKE